MTARSASCRSSTTAPSNGSPTRSWTTTRPTSDIAAFFRRFRQALEARGLTVQGITTDGSRCIPSRSPQSSARCRIRSVQFHILREVTKAVLSAVAQERKGLAAAAPKLPRGRPRARRPPSVPPGRKKRIEQKVGELFEHRYLFVQRRLSPSERATLQRISRGLPAAPRACAS